MLVLASIDRIEQSQSDNQPAKQPATPTKPFKSTKLTKFARFTPPTWPNLAHPSASGTLQEGFQMRLLDGQTFQQVLSEGREAVTAPAGPVALQLLTSDPIEGRGICPRTLAAAGDPPSMATYG